MLDVPFTNAPPSCEMPRAFLFVRKPKRQQTEDGGRARKSGYGFAIFEPRVCSSSPALSSITTKTKEHHDRAGVDDDLRGGEELCAERPVQHRQRHHHDHQRKRRVDRVVLQQQVERCGYGEQSEDGKQGRSAWFGRVRNLLSTLRVRAYCNRRLKLETISRGTPGRERWPGYSPWRRVAGTSSRSSSAGRTGSAAAWRGPRYRAG